MVEIAFTGDITFTKHLQNACYDENLLDERIVKFLSSADHTVVNVEGAISGGTTRIDKPLVHANPAGCVHWLKKVHGDIWCLANNHSMDSVYDGFLSTMEAARACGVRSVAVGKQKIDPVYFGEVRQWCAKNCLRKLKNCSRSMCQFGNSLVISKAPPVINPVWMP